LTLLYALPGCTLYVDFIICSTWLYFVCWLYYMLYLVVLCMLTLLYAQSQHTKYNQVEHIIKSTYKVQPGREYNKVNIQSTTRKSIFICSTWLYFVCWLYYMLYLVVLCMLTLLYALPGCTLYVDFIICSTWLYFACQLYYMLCRAYNKVNIQSTTR
jgi:hypothetical protein